MSIKSPRNRHRHQSGLTMVELLIFIVIVSIAVAGILGVMSYTTRNSADPQLRKQALAIAEGLLEEVQSARYTYCDPNDATAEDAIGPFITGATGTVGVGCTSTVEAVGHLVSATRPYSNIIDYVTAFGETQNVFNNAAGNLVDVAGTRIAPTGAYTATLMLRATDTLNDIASTATPATMNVLRLTVQVRYNGGRDSVTLEGYRTRYAPNFLP